MSRKGGVILFENSDSKFPTPSLQTIPFVYSNLPLGYCIIHPSPLSIHQHRALSFVYNDFDSDYVTLLNRANMPSLELSRQRQLCVEVFKCIHELSPKYMCNLFSLQDKQVHNTKSVKMLIQNHYNSVTYGRKTFVHYATHVWNKLPNSVKSTNDLDSFKELINTWYGMDCKCNFCKSLNDY